MLAKALFASRCRWLSVIGFPLLVTGCMTPQKMDRFIAAQYGNRIAPVSQGKEGVIKVRSRLPQKGTQISSTVKTSKTLPLIFYWHIDYRTTSTLNTAIPVDKFTRAILSMGRRKLVPKLQGRQLEISIDQLPHSFTLEDNEHIIWLVYMVHWAKLGMLPSGNDMVVDYRLTGGGATIKQGKITIQDIEKPMPIGMFQSWKKVTATYISRYNYAINQMSESVVDQLAARL